MKIKILHLTTDSKIAGTERLLLELAEKNSRDIFDMHFCTLAPWGRFHQQIQALGLHSCTLGLQGLRNTLSVYIRLLKLLKRERFDIVHTHLFLSSFLGLTAAHLAGVPFCVMTRHYSDYMYLFGNCLKIKVDRLCLRLCDRVIAVSNAVADVIKNRDKIDSAKICPIHNGIDLAKFLQQDESVEEAKRHFGLDGFYIVGAVGSLQPRKGHSFLIKAVPVVLKRIPRAKFIIVGAGPLLDALKNEVRQRKLERHVLFWGYRDDIYRVMAMFDVFVHPSVEEGFGIAILEALAMGKPVVASSVGGIREIIHNHNTDYNHLVPPADPDRLSAAIINILNSRLNLQRVKAQGRKIIQERFSAKKMVDKYEQVYKDLMLKETKEC